MSEYTYTPKDGDKPDRISPPDRLNIPKSEYDYRDGCFYTKYLEDGASQNTNTPFNTIEACASYNDANAPFTFGNVIITRLIGTSQLFMPWNDSTEDPATIIAHPLYYRSITDTPSNYGQNWTPWRRIAYYDEIEAVVTEILKSKGLIT